MAEPTLAELRRQLDALDDPQVDALCLDHFPEVYNRLGRGMRRDEKVTLLLDHCRRTEGGPRRLADLLRQDQVRGAMPAPTAPVITSPFNLPSDLADFTGRDAEVAGLRQRLSEGGVVAMAGMGGIGKTVLAVHVARQLAAEGRFEDAQLYLDLRGAAPHPLDPAAALGSLLAAVAGPDPRRPADAETLTGLWRAAIQGKDALLLLDNAANAAQVKPLLPGCPSCAVLVTSRQRFTLPGAILIDLERMPEQEARALLQTLAPRLDDAGADDIARLCGGLPMALRIAGNYLALNDDCSAAEYARRLSDVTRLRDPDDPNLDVAAAIALSVDQLDPEARRAWTLLGLFPAPFDAPAAAALWATRRQVAVSELPEEAAAQIPPDVPEVTLVEDLDEEETLDRLRALRNRSLLAYDDDTGRYDLHDLLRLAATREMQTTPSPTEAEDVSAVRDSLAQHYLSIAQAAVEAQHYPALDADWPHLRAALEYAAGRDDEGGRSLLTSLVWTLSVYLDLRGMFSEWIGWLELGIAAAQGTGYREAEAEFLNRLGMACTNLGDTQSAIDYYEQALAIAREIGDRLGEGNHLGNLGIAYTDLGEPRRAIDYYEQALAIQREIGDRLGEGNQLGNLGLAYLGLGEPQRAIDYHEQALAIDREIGDRRGEGADLGNLGLAYAGLGEPRRAIDYYEQALAIQREIGGRRGEESQLGNLGSAYLDLNEPRRAIDYYEQALAIAREIGDRRGEGNHLGNLGVAYTDLGEPQREIDYYEQALAIAREIGDRRGEGNHLANLGLAHEEMGDPARARELWAEALRIYQEIEDPHTEMVRGWLAEPDADPPA